MNKIVCNINDLFSFDVFYEAFNLISVFVENHSLLSGTDEIPCSMNQNVNGWGLFHGYCTISKNVNHFIYVTK